MVIKHAEEARHRNSLYMHTTGEQKKLLLKGANSTLKAFSGPKQGNLNATNEKVLEFLLEEHKNYLSITSETKMAALEVNIP
jgi:hypothetical protein